MGMGMTSRKVVYGGIVRIRIIDCKGSSGMVTIFEIEGGMSC